MTTRLPRLKVTLTEEQYELLRRLAAQQGCSMSSVLVDLFESARPVLTRVADVVDAAKNAQQSVRDELVRSMEVAEAQLAPLVGQAQGAFVKATEGPRGARVSQGSRPGFDAGGEASRREGHPPAAVPPSSNTGVRSPKTTMKSRKSHAI